MKRLASSAVGLAGATGAALWEQPASNAAPSNSGGRIRTCMRFSPRVSFGTADELLDRRSEDQEHEAGAHTQVNDLHEHVGHLADLAGVELAAGETREHVAQGQPYEEGAHHLAHVTRRRE